MSVFDDVFDDNYPSQILVDEVFDAEHNAGLFDEISVVHQAIMDQNWKAADAQIKHIESLMNPERPLTEEELIESEKMYYAELKNDDRFVAQMCA